MSENLCPCGSEKEFAQCCAPYLEGKDWPTTGEAMVRSRFSAFSKGSWDYLVQSTHPDFRDELTASGIAENTAGIEWLRLDIQESGQTPAKDGGEPFETVTFSVLYQREDHVYQMGETSYFAPEEGRLYYVEGMSHRPVGYRRPEPKVGRNDPCTCGSGKKYKKCCANKADAD